MIVDQLQAMSIFVAVAQEQGFAAGARRLGLSPPAVTRAIAALEDKLGVRLLTRTTRHVRVTDSGLRYLEDTRRILDDVVRANDAVKGVNVEARGELSITAPVLFGRMFVMAGIIDYLNQYPATQVRAIFLDRNVNLLEEGIDVGVRIGELADSSMRARKVGEVRAVWCASPDYLAKHGSPSDLIDLNKHTLIRSTAARLLSQRITKNLPPRLSVSDNDAAIEAARQGFGITQLLSYQIAPLVESGELVVVLEEFEPDPLPVNIVHREDRYASLKVRALVDLLVDLLVSRLGATRC